MVTVAEMLRRFDKIDLDNEIKQTFYDTRDDFVTQQQHQITDGIRADGKPIFNVITGSDEYSPGYARKKGKRKPIDLHLSGEFQNDIFIDVRDNEVIVDSADSKSGDLQKRYGGAIFGLYVPFKQNYIDKSKPVFIGRIQDKLKLK